MQNTVGKWIIDDYRGFLVNVISWFGKDMKIVDELSCRDLKNAGVTDPATENPVQKIRILVSKIRIRIRNLKLKLNLNAGYKTFIMIKNPRFYSVLQKIKRTLFSSCA